MKVLGALEARRTMQETVFLLDRLERQLKGTQRTGVRAAAQSLRWVLREVLKGDE